MEEDPWGSPWADEVQHQPPSNPSHDIEVKPVAPLRSLPVAGKLGIDSPWGNEADGFGDWTTRPELEETGLKADADAVDGWGTKETFGPSKPSGELNGKPPPSWDNTPEISVDRSPSVLSPSADIVRERSPDPWATRTTSHIADNEEEEQGKEASTGEFAEPNHFEGPEENTLEEYPSSKGAENPPSDEHASKPSHLLELEDDQLEKETSGPHSRESNLSHVLVGHDVQESPGETIGINIDGEAPITSLVSVGIKDASTEEHRGIFDVTPMDHESSRPSTSPSDHSHHDDVPESPRTSLDEEQGRPQTKRRAHKVQELVQHFDGIIAKQTEVENPILRTISPKKSRKDSTIEELEEETEDEEDDFGDFEEGMSDVGDTSEEQISLHDATTAQTSTGISEKLNSRNDESSTTKKNYGPFDFDIDLSIIDKIYSDLQVDPPTEKIFIPETMIRDSFVSVEQRKTWYRISRYGSMRKHNSGDDDNYRRVRWPKSHVREEILKVVGRWMEEDRISGRVVLGGGSKGSSIFGWNDSSKSPAPVSLALAAKRGKKKSQEGVEIVAEVPREWPKMPSRHSSSRAHGRRLSSAKDLPQSDAALVDAAPVANFGWNTFSKGVATTKPTLPAQEKSKVTSRTRSESPKSSPLRRSTSTTQSPLSKKVLGPKEPVATAPQQPQTLKPRVTKGVEPIPTPTFTALSSMSPEASIVTPATTGASSINTQSVSIDEDDEWGEMVSSPSIAPVQTFPTPKLQHEKSLSLNGSSSIMFPGTTTLEPQKSSSHRSHKSTASLDGVTIPQSVTSAWPNSASLTGATPEKPSYSGTEPPVSNVVAPNATTANSTDPWASADLSIFDSKPTPAPAPRVAPRPAPRPSVVPAKAVSFARSPLSTIESAASAPARGRKDQRSREEAEQDRIVRSIVDALPDLSYMLR